MRQYVCGIALSEDRRNVVMIHKNRPTSLAGKLNFPGGKVEIYEFPSEAVAREFQEETGVFIPEDRWELIAVFGDESFVINFFKIVTDDVWGVRTIEDEEVSIYPVESILDEHLLIKHFGIRLNQPCSLIMSLALQKQIKYPVHFTWNGIRDNSQEGI